MKYRKKSVIIDAMKWTGTPESNKEFIAFSIGNHVSLNTLKASPLLIIQTLEGVMEVNVGDYVIKGVLGEIYPCKPEVFEMSYEKVE